MDSHHFDVIVVGAGISGLTAAGAAARHNQKVALVATGPGSFVLRSGCLKAQELMQPGSKQEIGEAVAFFQEMAQAAGDPFEGNISEVRYLPTIFGDFQGIALAPRSLWNADPRSDATTAIVGIRELSCFDENFMAERMNGQARGLGFVCTYAARQISLSRIFGGPVTTLRIATRFDSDPGFRSELVNVLKHAASGFERVLVPGILGLHSSAQQFAQFERELGCSLSELATLPPSVSGLRLFNRLWGYLHEIGVELFQGFPVLKVQIQDGTCTELQVASPGHTMILRGECVVLAAGQDSAGLLGTEFARCDEQMRPLTSTGSVVAWNLFVAESGSYDRTEGSGDDMEILAGYRTGNLAAAARGRYAVG
ncbi:MAG TPA: FAD-binding protein [Terracidiphilus sp.]|nr:FAD-binding protein [Terracidiphilus sp.]